MHLEAICSFTRGCTYGEDKTTLMDAWTGVKSWVGIGKFLAVQRVGTTRSRSKHARYSKTTRAHSESEPQQLSEGRETCSTALNSNSP